MNDISLSRFGIEFEVCICDYTLAHRIYGEIRLKLLFLDKFKELEWIGCEKNYINTCPIPTGNPAFIQPIIVLQK